MLRDLPRLCRFPGGLSKDRNYPYPSRWHADLRVAHIVPHRTWPEREVQITPVHASFRVNGTDLVYVNVVGTGLPRLAVPAAWFAASRGTRLKLPALFA